MTLIETLALVYVGIDFLASVIVGVVVYRNRYTLAARLRAGIRSIFGVETITGRLASIEDTLGYFQNRRQILDDRKGVTLELTEEEAEEAYSNSEEDSDEDNGCCGCSACRNEGF